MPNPIYTLKEKQEWLKYHHQGESPEKISKHFNREHPDRPKPSKNTIKAAIKRFEDTGRFDRSEPYTQPRKAVPLEKRILVCAAVEAGGGCASASSVAKQFDLSESSVRKIWKEEGFGDGKITRITIGSGSRKKTKNPPPKGTPDEFFSLLKKRTICDAIYLAFIYRLYKERDNHNFFSGCEYSLQPMKNLIVDISGCDITAVGQKETSLSYIFSRPVDIMEKIKLEFRATICSFRESYFE